MPRQLFKKLGLKYVDPFPIKTVIYPVTVELELLKTLRWVHTIFHCSLLKLETNSFLYPAMKPLANLIVIKDEQHLKAIVDSLTDQGKPQYPTAWKAFYPLKLNG